MAVVEAAGPATIEDARDWPYRFEVVPLSRLFADDTYQRPLTSFVDKIIAQFEPALVGTLVVSGRKGGKYAVVDGQTRLEAMRELGMREAPCLVYTGLTLAQEASLFARLQRERRGIASYHRFRAALVAGEEEPKLIEEVVGDCGYTIGIEPGEISAVAALEYAFRRDPEILERTLLIFKAAWPTDPSTMDNKPYIPPGDLIKGLAYLLANGLPPKGTGIDDEKMADRMRQVTPEQIRRRASAIREGVGGGGGNITYTAQALATAYRKKG